MIVRSSVRASLTVGTLALVSACQVVAPTRLLAPTFRLDGVSGAAAPASAQAGQAAVAVKGQPASAEAPRAQGQLTVRFDHLLGAAPRQLMAVVADVDRVTIRLQGAGVDHTETIAKAQLTGGMTSFTFTGLPVGPLTVTIQALDAGGQVLGRDVQQATVTAGVTTTVTSTVLLNPAIPTPRVIAAGTGGGGSPGGATGSLTTTVTLQDGLAVRQPPIEAIYFAGSDGGLANSLDVQDVNLHVDGSVWALAQGRAHPRLYRFQADGTLSEHTPTQRPDDASLPFKPFRMDATSPTGQVLVLADGSSPGWMLAADGSPSANQRLPANAWLAKLDANNRLWVVPTPFTHTPGVTPIHRYELGDVTPQIANVPGYGSDSVGGVQEIALASDQRLWAIHMTPEPLLAVNFEPTFHAFALDGTMTETARVDVIDYSRDHLAPDLHGNVWIFANDSRNLGGNLVKLSPTGAVVAAAQCAVPEANQSYVDANEDVWAYNGSVDYQNEYLVTEPTVKFDAANHDATGGLIARHGPDGRLKAYYQIGAGVHLTKLVVTADGTLWAGTGQHGLIKLKVDMPFVP